MGAIASCACIREGVSQVNKMTKTSSIYKEGRNVSKDVSKLGKRPTVDCIWIGTMTSTDDMDAENVRGTGGSMVVNIRDNRLPVL